MTSSLLAAAFTLATLLPSAPRPVAMEPGAPADTSAIRAAIRRAEQRTGGTIGVHVRHLESGRTFSARAGEPFFMASVCKLPIAVHVLRQVERGHVRLDDTVRLGAARVMGGDNAFRQRVSAGSRVSVAELLEAAVSDSDNTAANELLHLSGGPDSVTAGLRRAGLRGVRVDRDYTRLSPPSSPSDTRDTMTPEAATGLLAALWSGRLLGEREKAVLLGWMNHSRNPARRIVAGVPAGTAVAHKTGTWPAGEGRGTAALNDVGVITLPGGGGHLAVAVFVRDARAESEAIEPMIAEITRAAYAHWAGRSR